MPFMAVRGLYEKTESITISDPTESEIINKLVHVAVLYIEITGGDRDLTAKEEAQLAEERDALTALCEKEVVKCSS